MKVGAPKSAAPKPAAPKPAAPAAKSSTPTKPATSPTSGASSTSGSKSSSSTSKTSRGSTSNPGSKDKVTLGKSDTGSTERVDDLKKGLDDNYGLKEATKDPRSSFFKDPQHLEKLDAAKTELKEAREGNHQELQDLKARQTGERNQELSKEVEAKEKAQTELETAEKEYAEVQKQAQERLRDQPVDHARAKGERDTARGELNDIKKPGQPSAASYVDRVDQAQQKVEDKKKSSVERTQAADQNVSDQNTQLEDRYGEQFEKNPQLRDDMKRYRELDESIDSKDSSGYERTSALNERNALRSKFNGVTDSEGNRLSNDFSKLRGAEDKAEAIKASDKRTVDMYQKQYEETKKKATEAYGNTPGLGQKIQRYRAAKDNVQATSPEGVQKTNVEQVDDARTRVAEAKETKAKADADFQQADDAYNKEHGAENAKELATKQNDLIESMEKKVGDLSTIKPADLSDGILKSPGAGYPRDIKLDGDTLKFHNGYGTDFTAKPTEDGGFQIDGLEKRGNQTTTTSTRRAQNEDGTWRNANRTRTSESPGAKSVETLQENEDGSSVKTSRTDYKESNDYFKTPNPYFQSRTVTGADGSQVTESQSRKYGQETTSRSRKSADGREERFSRSEDLRDSSWSETHSTKDAQGVETTNTKDFSERDWANSSNVEGASWLWKHSPQNLRNAIGEDATYGTYSETSSVREPGQKAEVTSQTQRERWTSADGRRTLDAQRGQKGMPDTWTYATKKGDTTRSQTFIRGTEDTSISKSYTDRDGYKVTETSEDFRDTAEKVKEASGHDMAATGNTIQKLKDVASAEDLNKLIKDHPELKELTESDNFKRFMDEVGDGKFSLAFQDSEQTMTDGKDVYSTSLNATAENGTSLTYVGGQDGAGVQYHKPGEESKGRYIGTTMFDEGGNRLETANDGSASLVSAKGARQILKDAETLGTAAFRTPRAISKLPSLVNDLTGLGKVGKSGKLMTSLAQLDEKFKTNFGKGLDKVALGLNAFHTVSSAYQGNWGEAANGLASTATDVGALAGNVGQGWKAGTYVDKLGKSANMWDDGATLAGVSRTAQIGKALGAAGAVYQLGSGAYDIYQGNYARGALGVAGAGGTALAIWGGASWAGPVGWGLAAAATAGIYTIDYVDSNAIAEPAIPLR